MDIMDPRSSAIGMRKLGNLLRPNAKEGVAKSVTSGRFIAAHSLKGASSVHLSLKKLLEDELLYETDEGFVVYDRLFGMWLARLPE